MPLLIIDWRKFSRRVTARWWRQWAKNLVLTNQNSRNRWCHIVRRTICRTEYNLYWRKLYSIVNLVLHSDFIIIHQTYCPATIYLFKFNTGNTRIIKSQECRWRRSGSLFFNFKQISYIVLVFPLLTFNMQMPAGQYFNSTKFPAKHRRYTFVYHSYIFVYIRSYIFVHKVYSIPYGRLGEFSWGFSGISGQLFWKEPRKQLLLYYRHLKTIATIKMIMAYLRVHGEKIFVGPCYNTVSSYHKHHNNWNQSSKPGISEKENDKILHRFVWSSYDLKFRSIVY